MHPVFALDEIVNEILLWLSMRNRTVMARINRTWFQVALPFIWRDISVKEGLCPIGPPIGSTYRDVSQQIQGFVTLDH